ERNKLLLPTRSGKPLIAHSLGLYLDLNMRVTLVVPPDSSLLVKALGKLADTPNLRLVTNPQPGEDQGASARVGLAATSLGQGVLIALADQPLLTGQDVAALLSTFAAHGGQRIVIPRFDGVRGNPVILPAGLAQALHDCPADVMPRTFILANSTCIAWHEAQSEAFTTDVDTPADAARLLGGAPLFAPAQPEIAHPEEK
ncbi:MAG TPA: NTP transferase domain-containing protein, partial [Novosphingobium sp.]|nr:NTP transferase domain-containing protein [Novosphingobium sp.]